MRMPVVHFDWLHNDNMMPWLRQNAENVNIYLGYVAALPVLAFVVAVGPFSLLCAAIYTAFSGAHGGVGDRKASEPYVIENAAAIRQELKAHGKRARQNGGRRKNKAVFQKRNVTNKAFTLPASWHGGRFKMTFSLKKTA